MKLDCDVEFSNPSTNDCLNSTPKLAAYSFTALIASFGIFTISFDNTCPNPVASHSIDTAFTEYTTLSNATT